MNKKGLIFYWGSLITVVIILFVIGAIILLIISINAKDKKDDFREKVSILDSSYQTRILLQQEIAPNYKVYEFIIDKVNENDYSAIDKKMPEIINAHMLDNADGEWFYVVNEHIGRYNTIRLPNGAVKLLPRTIIPNPEGQDIEVIIKKISPADFDIEYQEPISPTVNPTKQFKP